jgi:hypothetical protein
MVTMNTYTPPRHPFHPLLVAQVALVLFLLALIGIEIGFVPYSVIYAAGGVWGVNLASDPTYALRSLLILLNLLGAVFSLSITGWLLYRRVGNGTLAASAALTLLALTKSALASPFWINGVHVALTATPRPDMDPKDLLPAIWFPATEIWQLVTFGVLVAILLGIPIIEFLGLRGAWRQKQWSLFALTQVAVIGSLYMVFGIAGLGAWLGD